jgi:hypothetical protein
MNPHDKVIASLGRSRYVTVICCVVWLALCVMRYPPDTTRRPDTLWDYALGATFVIALWLVSAVALRFDRGVAVRGLVLILVWIVATGCLWEETKNKYLEDLQRRIESAKNDFAPLGGDIYWSRRRLNVIAVDERVNNDTLEAWLPLLTAHSVQHVDLRNSSVTESGLHQLADAPSMEVLRVRTSALDPDQMNDLRQRLPLCVIEVADPPTGE